MTKSRNNQKEETASGRLRLHVLASVLEREGHGARALVGFQERVVSV